jgi:hypothetical protein
MSEFWSTGGRLHLLDQWAAKESELIEDEPIAVDDRAMAAWLRLADSEQALIVNAYTGEPRTRRPRRVAA